MSALAQAGWIAPGTAGPSRRWRWRLVVLTLPLLAWIAYMLLVVGEPQTRRYEVRVALDGSAEVQLVDSSRTAASPVRPLRDEVRTSRGTRFLVLRGKVAGGGGPVATRVDVRPPPGIGTERVAVRFARARGNRQPAEVLVTMPVPASHADTSPTGSLAQVTEPFDERVRDARADRRLLDRLRSGWWWMAALGLLGAVVAPLWLWRRERRRFFSMRVPGPGRTMDSAPPSSLDPVGAAVLVAGARPADAAASFAGHVLDLVERRQLRLRRSTAAEGTAGAQLGLAHADEEAVPDDAAIAALRCIAEEDGLTVAVPDDPSRVARIPADAARAWREHVAARVRFERMSSSYRASRVAAAAAAFVAFAITGVIGAIIAPYEGGRAAGLLVAALALPAAVLLAAWARDAHSWRVVARDRRTERAQWLAWRRVVGTEDGPALDPRNLPVLAATGPVDGLVRETASRDAVALDAVTVGTVASLRAMLRDPR